ncbi:MAG: glycoside hydrolase family 16 protein [Clostridia bacterium]|nr:glycoside hydrolase family 16 protein [Clostridia bacterium]
MRKIISLLLCVLLVFGLCACSGEVKGSAYTETEDEMAKREALEATLRNLYACPTGYMFEKCMEPLDKLTSDELQDDMSFLLGSNTKFIGTATLFKEGEFTVYCVAAVMDYNTGEREIFNDIIIARETDGKQLIVMQKSLDEATQKALIAKRDENADTANALFESILKSFTKENNVFKEWYSKRKSSLKMKTTALNMQSVVKLAETVYNRDGRALVWSEEFENVTSLSQTKMAYHRTMNNPSLKLTKDDSNLSFENGTMTMYARPEGGAYHYSIPDGITTYGTMAYIGGYLEMRAKVPFEHGAWPSFWEKSYPGLYSTNYQAEIDIFEVFSDETSLENCLHKWGEEHYSGGVGDRREYIFASNQEATDWHTYGFEWTDTQYRFYIDGNLYCTLKVDDSGEFAPDLPGMEGFQDYHYVILNNFVFNKGSSWAPSGSQLADNETKVIEYTVDYIRLYQNKDKDKLIIFEK